MWNPFKKKILQPKYKIEVVTKEHLIHKYSCTIKMQNGEIFKTDLYDELHLGIDDVCLVQGAKDNWKRRDKWGYSRTILHYGLKYNKRMEPYIDTDRKWEFEYQGTTMKLNSDQISYVHYTKVPFETRQIEEEVLTLIGETSNA